MAVNNNTQAKAAPASGHSIVQNVFAKLAGNFGKAAAKQGDKGKCDCKAVSAHKGKDGFDCKKAEAGDKKTAATPAVKDSGKGAVAGKEQAAVKGNKQQKKELGEG